MELESQVRVVGIEELVLSGGTRHESPSAEAQLLSQPDRAAIVRKNRNINRRGGNRLIVLFRLSHFCVMVFPWFI